MVNNVDVLGSSPLHSLLLRASENILKNEEKNCLENIPTGYWDYDCPLREKFP